MTPVREALRQLVYRIRRRSTNKLHNREYQMTLDDCVRELEALSAAPGEPCAVKLLEWKNNRADVYSVTDVHGQGPRRLCVARGDTIIAWSDDETAAKELAQADYEQRIRSALVPTPQPAAGWDVRLEARPADGGDWTEIFPAQLNWVVKQGHEVRTTEVRREAPAPAEGVLTLGPENEAFHRALKQYPEGFAALHFFWNEVFAGQPQSRPDTADARLREAANAIQQLDPLAIKALESHQRQLDQDGVEVGVSRQAVDEIVLAVKSMRKALSTGDEAKESDPPAWFEPITPSRLPIHGQEVDALNEERRREAWNIRPSEPSPPADRREIVAWFKDRIDKYVTQLNATGQADVAHLLRRDAQIILAALDGGRDA